MLMLKSENNKLKEKNIGMKDVEQLMQTNTHENFHNESQQIETGENAEIFNMTDYNNLKEQSMFKKSFVPQSDDSQTNGKENDHYYKDRTKSISSMQGGNSPGGTIITENERFPSLYPSVPFSKVIEQRETPRNPSSNSTNFSNFQIGSSYLKDNLSKKGRCPICTLPLPCKHYNTVDEFLPLQPSKYILPPAVKAIDPMVYKTARNTTIDPSKFQISL
jgi:hypothetical protein